MAIVANSLAACFPAPLPGVPRDDDNTTGYSLPQYADGTTSTVPSRAGSLNVGSSAAGANRRSFSWRRLVGSYWTDWVLIAALEVALSLMTRSAGHKREFSLRELSIQHSFAAHERVGIHLLVGLSLALPAGVLLALSVLVAKNAWDVHNSLCGLGMSWTMAGVVTQVIKMGVGRPRPDLIARCLPREGATDHPVFGLSTVAVCTQANKFILDDGFKSFPSGHSSLSFAGLGFLTFYLAGKMHLYDAYGNRNRAWFALSPLLLAAMIAITRAQDNRHHWHDILVGSTLGLVIAIIAYRTYYPNLSNPMCHLPLLPRPSVMPDDDESEVNTQVRLLSDESGVPRPSDEERAWRS